MLPRCGTRVSLAAVLCHRRRNQARQCGRAARHEETRRIADVSRAMIPRGCLRSSFQTQPGAVSA